MTAAAAVLLTVCFLAECILPGEEIVESIERDAYGKGDKQITAVAEIGYKGKTVEKNVELNISQEELSQEEKLERLEECRKDLPNIIVSGNTNLEHISEDMDLITSHEDALRRRQQLLSGMDATYPECSWRNPPSWSVRTAHRPAYSSLPI